MDSKFNILIISFITLVIGIPLLISIADQTKDNTILSTVANTTFTASNTTCVKVTNGCMDSITQVRNQSVILTAANYSLCRIGGEPKGVLLGAGAGEWSGTSLNATYVNSVDCMYVNDATSRNLVPLLVIFFAIALVLAVGYWLFQKGAFDF